MKKNHIISYNLLLVKLIILNFALTYTSRRAFPGFYVICFPRFSLLIGANGPQFLFLMGKRLDSYFDNLLQRKVTIFSS
jgi:hypothetical protein